MNTENRHQEVRMSKILAIFQGEYEFTIDLAEGRLI
jgi:hypothetical protein